MTLPLLAAIGFQHSRMVLKEEHSVASCATAFYAGAETIAPGNFLTRGRKNSVFMLYPADLTRNQQN